MNPFSKALLDFALSLPPKDIRDSCLECLEASDGNRRQATLRFGVRMLESLKESFRKSWEEGEERKPSDALFDAVFMAAMELVQWEIVGRILFDRYLPMRCRPVVMPSVN